MDRLTHLVPPGEMVLARLYASDDQENLRSLQHRHNGEHLTAIGAGGRTSLWDAGEVAQPIDAIEAASVTREDGDAGEFDLRFARARDRLVRICASLVGIEEAEDVVHDAYMLGRRRFDQLRDGSAFDAWLTRIAVNLCFSRHRRIQRLRRALPALVRPALPPSDVGLRELVESLPPRERTVLVLHYGHGYRLEEIAALLDLTHTNVRTIIARTRKRLYAAWQQAEGADR